MSYLKFDKEQLINLEYSLNREIIRSNKAGSYISTTLNGCNTRKYHGLLICPIDQFNGEKHVLLSSLDSSIIWGDEEFNMGIHRYNGGIYNPKGHKYINDIEFGQIPKIKYQIGNIVLIVERILVEKKEQLLIRYTLINAPGKITLRFKPFLAFRNIHNLSKANLFVNTKYKQVKNGISTCLYSGYPDLHMQFSKANEFIPVPDWYYNIEYIKEFCRGYEYHEDLFVPGYFELSLLPGESLIFAAGTESSNPISLKQRFTKEQNKHKKQYTFRNVLKYAGEQFIFQRNNKTDIVAGFPWYESISRQSLISLPGLSLCVPDKPLFAEVLNTYKKQFKDGLLPDNIHSVNSTYNTADAPLWFIWAVQKYSERHRSPRGVWLNYKNIIKYILSSYRYSKNGLTHITKDGLIYADKKNTALTWMDSYINNKPVVPRAGMAIEINALWYNAIAFSIKMARETKDTKFIKIWGNILPGLGHAFLKTFYNNGHLHPADVVKNSIADWSVRPNMVIAAAMKFSPLSKEQKKQILTVTKKELLTKRGLRTLSPAHMRYKGTIEGNQSQREGSIHQGGVWPWLIQFFVEAYLDIHGQGGIPFVEKLIKNYEEAMTEHSVGTLSEVYTGDPPHNGRGAISQAWNVAAIIYAMKIINDYKKIKN